MQLNRVTCAGLLDAAIALTCITTLAGFAGRFWWVLELATHFRVQYALLLGAGALSMLIRRRYGWVAVYLAFALLNAVQLTPRLLPGAKALIDEGPTFRVLLANVNSDNRDYPAIRRAMIAHDPDFIVLLEVTPWLMEQLTDLAEPYPHRVAEPRLDNFGIALLSRRPFLNTIVIAFGPTDLPSIKAEFLVDERHFTLLGTHPLPPVSADLAHGRNEQLAWLAELARQARQPLLLLGDLNVSPWSPWFGQLLTDSGLRDSGKGRGIQPTWPADWPLLWIPIDHALFSDGIRIQRRTVGPAIGSDHYPVLVEFQVVKR